MDRTRQRIAVARQALATLRDLDLAAGEQDSIVRDAAIQRFEYSFETAWKAAQTHLKEVERLVCGSPRAAIRASVNIGALDDAEAEQALQMADDRNLSTHTYNEELARQLLSRLPGWLDLLTTWMDRIEEQS